MRKEQFKCRSEKLLEMKSSLLGRLAASLSRKKKNGNREMSVIVKSPGKSVSRVLTYSEVMVGKLVLMEPVLISTQSRGQRSAPAAFRHVTAAAVKLTHPMTFCLKSIVSSPTLYSFHQLLQNHFIIKLWRSSRRNRFQEKTHFCSCLDEYFAFKKKQTLTQFAGNLCRWTLLRIIWACRI